MSGESDFDDDIDKLLDEIDSAGQQRKAAKPLLTAAKPTPGAEEAEGTNKITLKSDGNGFKVNYGGGGFKLSDLSKPAPGDSAKATASAKSVHFPPDPIPTSSQPPPQPQSSSKPNFLSNLLGKEATTARPESPTQSAPTKSSSAAKADWLGLGPLSSSPISSPKLNRKLTAPKESGNDSTINFDDDDDNAELLKAMGLDSARRPKPTEEPKKAPLSNPPTAKPKTGLDLDDDFWPKPGSFKPPSAPSTLIAKSDTFDKPEPIIPTTAPSSLLQRAKLAREREESPFDSPPVPKFQPTATSTPQSQQQQMGKSIVDVLPFLKRPGTDEQPESLEPPVPYPPRSMTSTPQQQQQQPLQSASRNPTPPVTKAKIKKAAAAAAAAVAFPPLPTQIIEGRTTLQLPSHLVDEEELKSMSHSLKTLYSNQLEMLEKSYQEQMDCLLQSHSRKEELLKEEIKELHKDYDSRLVRLKNELLESETKIPQRLQNELSMAAFSQQFQQPPAPSVFKPTTAETESPRSVHHNVSSTPNHGGTSTQEIEKLFDEKLPKILESFKSSLPKESISNGKELKELAARLDSMQRKFEAFANFKVEEESKRAVKLIDSEKKVSEELTKIYKQQRKVKEGLVRATVTAVSQTLQYYQDENSHKKDKIAGQLKEFRKDVRRVLYDLETKNESMQKSHVHVEADQKEILQTLRDLQTLVQVNSVHNKLASWTIPQQQFLNGQQNQQSEMEVKLLREERNALSESIAQMNVERRKLSEEKLNLEQDKMNLEREKNRLRDLEVQLRVKTAEAEDMKKQAEEVRKNESAKVMEVTMRASEIERERSMLKEQHHLTENKLRVREHKLIQEKAELMREKEFLEKLRDQLLCPGCMKSVNQLTSSRSEGDGLDISFSAAGDLSSRIISSALLAPENNSYFQKESLYLDDLYYKQFK